MDEDPDYVLQQELEVLAGNAYTNLSDHEAEDPHGRPEPMSTTILRWQTLFSLSADQAIDRIQAHRNNLIRTRITDDHWQTIRAEQEDAGYDCEAYEYALETQKRRAALPDAVPAATGSGVRYLVELEGVLDEVEKVQRAAGMAELPEVVSGTSVEEGRGVRLCCLDEAGKVALRRFAAEVGGGFEPTILVDPRSLQ